MREKYGRYRALALLHPIRDKATLREAYACVVNALLGRQISPRVVGPILMSLKALGRLFEGESVAEAAVKVHPFDVFLELPENRDLKDRYLAYLRAKVKEETVVP